MVSDNYKVDGDETVYSVLILILLEDGLWQIAEFRTSLRTIVLILILLEDGLWLAYKCEDNTGNVKVLILILLEDGLWLKSWFLYGAQN